MKIKKLLLTVSTFRRSSSLWICLLKCLKAFFAISLKNIHITVISFFVFVLDQPRSFLVTVIAKICCWKLRKKWNFTKSCLSVTNIILNFVVFFTIENIANSWGHFGVLCQLMSSCWFFQPYYSRVTLQNKLLLSSPIYLLDTFLFKALTQRKMPAIMRNTIVVITVQRITTNT